MARFLRAICEKTDFLHIIYKNKYIQIIHGLKALFKTDLMAYVTPSHVQRGQGHGRQQLGRPH